MGTPGPGCVAQGGRKLTSLLCLRQEPSKLAMYVRRKNISARTAVTRTASKKILIYKAQARIFKQNFATRAMILNEDYGARATNFNQLRTRGFL